MFAKLFKKELIEPIKFIEYLKNMGVGMLGIFLIIGIIILATYAISAVTEKIAKRRAEKEAEE